MLESSTAKDVGTRRGLRNSAQWFQTAVVDWFGAHGRTYPWRDTSEPFLILVAEVLLRQTQADRVVAPFTELTSRYATPHTLSRADIPELRAWFAPLGLVKRADSLVQAARLIVHKHGGHVPGRLGDLLGLPGLGTYSARAVLCMGFGAPVPMIDEGSGRVLRRVLQLPSAGPAYSDRRLLAIAERLLPNSGVREFNLGLIDIAAACCHSARPECSDCPLEQACKHTRGTGFSP